MAQGGTLEDRPRYNNSRCFDTFPFPGLSDGSLKDRLRDLGERLDAHRKARQAAHPDLTLTGMYNVLDKLRTGEPLTAKDKDIHDKGLVTLLKQMHDEIDRAVLEAYNWLDLLGSNGPETQDGKTQDTRGEDGETKVSEGGGTRQHDTALGDEPPPAGNIPATDTSPNQNSTIINRHSSSLHALADLLAASGPDAEALTQSLLSRLVALNHERAAEEKRGLIRWLRPDYQAPQECTTGVSPVAPGNHRQDAGGTLQNPASSQSTLDLPVTSPPSSLSSQPSSLAQEWPKALPEQVLSIRNLLPVHGPDPALLSAVFGRKNQKRESQIATILATLEALGKM